MYKPVATYLISGLFFTGLFIIYLLFLDQKIIPALALAAVPAILLSIAAMVRKHYLFYAFFVLNYVIMGIDRYVPLKSGMIMTAFALGLILLLLVRNVMVQQEWQRSKNFLTAAWGIWGVYCLFEFFNPHALLEPWAIAFPNYAFYPIVCSVVIPVLFLRHKNFQWLLILWAALSLLAAAKGYWQRNHGFDTTELHWLYHGGGGKTHLIHSGIRFFSFFTDAASYGASMGLSFVVFGISGFYTPVWWKKALFWVTAASSSYGLIISGTRSDLAIPFVGLAVYLLLCRNIKAIVITSVLLICSVIFLKFTTIGDNNRLIHRMRTAFDTEDASWMVRVGNKKKIYQLMQDKPLGIGLGLAGNKASRFRPENRHDPLTYIATDSWYIMTYIETGIIGLVLYLGILIAILLKGSYIATFKIRNRELQGQLLAIIAAISGILVTCYANEVLNYPNGIIVYTLMAFLFIAPYYDQELMYNESNS